MSESAKVWSSVTWTQTQTFTNAYIQSIEYLGDGLIAIGSGDWYLYIWNATTGINFKTIYSGTTVDSLKLVEKGSLLAAGMHSGWINVYNYTNGILFTSFLHCSSNYISSFELINKTLLASGCSDGTIKVWRWQAGVALFNLNGHTAIVNILKLAAINILASGSSDNTIKLWDITNGGALIKTLSGHSSEIYGLDVIESCVLISGSLDMSIKKWDLMNGGNLMSSFNTSTKIQSMIVTPPINGK
jgi:WD40 repeat protein